MRKIFIGLSGGVDSSVAAALLQQQAARDKSFIVEAVFMQNWRGQEERCTIKDDYADAQKVADALGIKLHFADFADRYWQDVFEFFLTELEAGRTPNPDILCNQHVKFDAFIDWAFAHGGSGIATGHYARLIDGQLSQACDLSKDQSYFLWAVPKDKLQLCSFPLGGFHKKDVRALATQFGLSTATKKDSVGICFIGPKNFRQFIHQYLCAQPGPIITTEGKTLGQHQGALFYTLGQRSGLQIGGQSGLEQLPWYVIGKDLTHNTITVAQDQNHPLLITQQLKAHNLCWHGTPPQQDAQVLARFRHLQPLQEATLRHSMDENRLTLAFKQPQRAINAGQAVVLYDKERCLVGGWIE